MAYEPTNWKSGDIITSTKLNKMEQGISGGGIVIPEYSTTDFETYVCNMTFADIWSAVQSGKCIGCYSTWPVTAGEIGYTSMQIEEAGYSSINFYAVSYNAHDSVLWITRITHSPDETITAYEDVVPLGGVTGETGDPYANLPK